MKKEKCVNRKYTAIIKHHFLFFEIMNAYKYVFPVGILHSLYKLSILASSKSPFIPFLLRDVRKEP